VASSAVLADDGAPVAESCPESLEVRYFPVGTFGPGNSDLFVRKWYSKHLVAMGEPSLSWGVLEDPETYRFLWLRTWQNPVAVEFFRVVTTSTPAITRVTITRVMKSKSRAMTRRAMTDAERQGKRRKGSPAFS